MSPLALAVIRAAGRGGSAGPDVLVQVALVVVLVDAGRTCGVRVVPAGCPVAGAPGRGRDLVVPAQITPLGPSSVDAGVHLGGRGDHGVFGPRRSPSGDTRER